MLSISLVTISNAEVTVPSYIENNTMNVLCSKNLSCWDDNTNWVKKYYLHKPFPKAMALGYKKIGLKYELTYIVASGTGWPTLGGAKKQALDACKKEAESGSTCTIFFTQNSIADKELYKKFMTKSIPANAFESGNSWLCKARYYKKGNKCLVMPANSYKKGSSWACSNGYKKSGNSCIVEIFIPKNAKAYGNGWTCNSNYYKKLNTNTCIKVPKNSTSSSLSNSFKCNTGFKKSGSKCIPKIIIPKNSHSVGSTWTCNTDYYRNNTKTACLKVPLHATSNYSSNYFKCNKDYKKSGNKCIPKIVIPKNAKASGSSFMCNNGYYKNSSTTGCLKVPAYAKKLSNDKGWSCSSGYTKTGKTCTNSAELKRIQEAKKIAQAKAAKVLKAAQLEAQNYYNDLEAFLKTNTKEYDTRRILELRKQNKVILTQPWDQVLEKNFAELKSFTATSKAFRDYHQLRNDARQRAVLNELDKANTRLKNIEAYLNYYVDNNLTSDIALEVLDQIDIAAAGLKKQSLDELSAVSMQLESFIAKNKLANNFKAFSKALAKITPDEPEVVVQKIDATDLVNFDFMKKANRADYIALINLSGKAPHALLDLEGSIVFENDKALSCFYQSKDTIKKDLKYYLYDKFSDKEYLVEDRGFECNQNNLLGYDLVFFEKGTLLKESKSYVASLAAAIAYNELRLYKKITKEEQDLDFAYRAKEVQKITEGIEEEMYVGFGALVIDNNNTNLCTDVDNSLGQISLMNLLANEFSRMGYGKSVSTISFNSVENTFANVQRGNCGFIYAGQESLAKLLIALKSSGTKYDILPIWYSKKKVKNEQLRQEGKNQSELIAKQKVKEQKDKDRKLAEQRAQSELEELKASGVLKAAEQKRLQARHRNTVEAHVQVLEKEAALLLDKDPDNTGPMLSQYPSLVDYMKDKLKEGWELDDFSVEINDFGLGNFRGRMIDTFITDINFRLKNRVLGEYDDRCARVAIIDDLEFDMLREPAFESCKSGSMSTYKQKLDFQSTWLVK